MTSEQKQNVVRIWNLNRKKNLGACVVTIAADELGSNEGPAPTKENILTLANKESSRLAGVLSQWAKECTIL